MRTCRAIAIVLVALLAHDDADARAGQVITQASLRAAFLYAFAKFTQWPAGAVNGPVTMCVMGDPDVAEALAQVVTDRSVSGRTVSVLTVDADAALRSCHLLYVSGDAVGSTQALKTIAGAPVLTVGDGDRFVRLGGMMGLFVEGGKMRFAVNPDTATHAGVRISSKLLSLAKLVKESVDGPS